jgi:predicted sulfurtransferase
MSRCCDCWAKHHPQHGYNKCVAIVVLGALQKKRVVVMDLRNDYEWDAGRFSIPVLAAA